jgi:hypothetical protein
MTISRAETPALPQSQPVVWLGWDDYLAWLRGELASTVTSWGETVELGPPWKPGEHWALIGPTGEGKSTHAVGILGQRDYVIALDPKGEDETLSKSGYARVTSLEPLDDTWTMIREAIEQARYRAAHGADARTWRQMWESIEAGGPGRMIIGGASRSVTEDLALQDLLRATLAWCRATGRFTVYVDEFELLSSQRMFNQGPMVERMLISARSAGTSVVTSYQAQAWVSHHATRQARRATMWPTGDRQMIKNVAESMGRWDRELMAAIDQLPDFHTLTIPRGKRHPMVITSAPEL